MMNKCLTLLLFLIMGGIIRAYSQTTSCGQVLRLAQSTYDQGRLHEIPKILGDCLKNSGESGFSKQERVNALRILTNTYIYLEEPGKADSTMLMLLETDHYFEYNNAIDPAEFIALYKTFRADPIFRIGVKMGSNMTQPNVVSYNPASEGSSSYGYRFGFNAAVSGEIPLPLLGNSLTINPELGMMMRSFSYSGTLLDYAGQTASETIGKENQTWLSLPVSIQYEYLKARQQRSQKKSKVHPYIAIGGAVDYLLSSSISAEQKRPGNQSVEGRSFDANPLREKLNFSVVGAVGLKVRVIGGFITAEARVYYGLNKINTRESVLGNQFLINDYSYADGIFKINSLSLTVGYAYNIFKPIKLKSIK